LSSRDLTPPEATHLFVGLTTAALHRDPVLLQSATAALQDRVRALAAAQRTPDHAQRAAEHALSLVIGSGAALLAALLRLWGDEADHTLQAVATSIAHDHEHHRERHTP
jgi:hypothetical protein